MPMARSLYYHHSGQTAGTGRLKMLISSCLTAAVVGALYGLASHYNPFIYLTLVLNGLSGIAISMVILRFVKLNHVRSMSWPLFTAVIAGAVAVYFNWVLWILAISKYQALVLHPVGIAKGLQSLAVEGVWSLRDTTPTGWFLLAIWGSEALLLIGVAVFTTSSQLKSLIYCEDCRHWLDAQTEPDRQLVFSPFVETPAFAAATRSLERGDMSALTSLSRLPDLEERPVSYLQVTIDRCLQCKKLNLLTVEKFTLGKKSNGNSQKKLLDRLVISERNVDELRTALADQPEPLATPPTEPKRETALVKR